MKQKETTSLPALSVGLELRPAGTPPEGLDPLIAPKLATWLSQIEQTIAELREASSRAGDPVIQAGIKAKIADLLLKLIRLGQQASADLGQRSSGTTINSQSDIGNWMDLPVEERVIWEELFDQMEAKFGDDWHRRGINIPLP